MSTISDKKAQTAPSPRPRWLDWRRLVWLAGLTVTAATTGIAIYLSDIEGGVVALVFATSTWLISVRKGLVGTLGLLLIAGVTYYFMVTAAFINFREGSDLEAMYISGGLAVLSFVAILAAIGFLIRRDRRATFGPWLVVMLGVLLLLEPFLVAGVRPADAEISALDKHLVAENVAFSESQITVSAGEVRIGLENRDLFWHTFSVEELGVDLRVPVGADLSIAFDAPPGEYEFFCDIPGHPEAGMMGTLVVES